ncbi:MAG: helix-turn-helix domain-containing protein [Sphingobacteriaceae bacterium]|nr:helix-turn-helix domain-containing protein [Sphingobacteriaceae bacterium]
MKSIPVRQIRSSFMEEVSPERFNIRTLEEVVGTKDLLHQLHRHNFFFILAVKDGSGTHDIDFTSYPVQNHSVFFIKPGQVHQLELKAGCSGYLMEFNNEFYHPINKSKIQRLRRASRKNLCQFDSPSFHRLDLIFKYILDEYADKQESYQDSIKANLDILMIELVRQGRFSEISSPAAHPYTQERLEEFFDLLEKHIIIHKQVSQYTDLMNLSSFQLNEITKETVGKTSSQLINEHIILEAKRHLLATPNQVKEIAELLGYEDVSYFIRFFKKHTGYSPEAYRLKSR